MVELCQAPVNEPEPSVLVVNHDVVRFHVPMHDPHAVAVVQGPQQLVQVAAYVVIGERLVQLLEIRVVDVLENEGRCAGHGVLHHAVQRDDVRAAAQVFQYFNLTLDFLLLDRFQCFHDALFIGGNIDGLENFAVFAAAQLSDELVVVLVPPLHNMGLVVPVLPGHKSCILKICIRITQTRIKIWILLFDGKHAFY